MGLQRWGHGAGWEVGILSAQPAAHRIARPIPNPYGYDPEITRQLAELLYPYIIEGKPVPKWMIDGDDETPQLRPSPARPPRRPANSQRRDQGAES